MADEIFTSTSLNTAQAPLSNPSITGGNDTGNTEASIIGSYEYKVTAFNGGETTGSASFYYNANGETVSIGFSLISGATDYRLYRGNSGSALLHLVANGTGQPLIDNGSISGGYIPTEDTSDAQVRSLGTLPSEHYVTPLATNTLFKEMLMNNNSDDIVSVSVYLVPTGEDPTIGNAIVYLDTLDSFETKIWSLNTVLPAGTRVMAKCDDIGTKSGWGSVSFRISGIEIQ